jgi:hypothetical protein
MIIFVYIFLYVFLYTFPYIILYTLQFFCCILIACLFEYILHSQVMHKVFLGFKYPFQAHAIIHHGVFKADHTYHLQCEKDKKLIAMAWWNALFLVPLGTSTTIPLSLYFGWSWSVCAFIAFGLYYFAYEYTHWCMHLPKSRRIEFSTIFRRLNGHHLLHHRYPNKNYNVVLPLGDLIFGTLITRSKVPFLQPRGPSVPDVQPVISPSV